MSLSRRLHTAGLASALVIAFAACAPSQASPTAAPAKPAESKPAAEASKPTAAAPAPAPAASPAAPAAKPDASPATAKPAASPGAGGAAASKPWEEPNANLIKGPFEGEAKKLNGAGATFPAALYSKWFTEYARLTGVEVNYQSIGSGGGIKGISDMTVDFGATDGPMTDEQLKAAKAGKVLHIPMALGAVAPTYNLPGMESTKLKFSPESLAGIFLGEIKKWSDPKIAADNAGASLPDKDIVVVHRSDGSGTTYIWVDYLSSVSETWKSKVGKGTSVNWPVGLGGKGNEGVAGEVKQNPYSIGYVELIYALQNRLGVGLVKNKAGQYVEPNLDSVSAAAAGAVAEIPADMRASIVNAAGPQSYPISGFTWLLVYEDMQDKARATALTRTMWWAIHDGQRFNGELGYAPLPAPIVTRAEEQVRSIKSGGQAAFPGR